MQPILFRPFKNVTLAKDIIHCLPNMPSSFFSPKESHFYHSPLKTPLIVENESD